MHALASFPAQALRFAESASGDFAWLLPALPLLGSAICGALHFLTLRARRGATHVHEEHASAHDHANADAGPSALAPIVAVLAMSGAFLVAVYAFVALHGTTSIASSAWRWIDTGTFPIDVAMVIDPLSSVMTLVITGVGLLIHVYAAGYMKGDPGYAKFFAYLNLFVFAMLVLVLSSSLLGLFVGWEGVGLCSYLLIGFWYEKGWPAEAGQKAFVMNRIGDACFLLGTFLIAKTIGTLDIGTIKFCDGDPVDRRDLPGIGPRLTGALAPDDDRSNHETRAGGVVVEETEHTCGFE